MAAVGAPEVITQLESAAKVLMVRTSALFSTSVDTVKHARSVSGGFRCLGAVAVVHLVTFFFVKCAQFSLEKHPRAMRGALPLLSPSHH